MKIKNNLNKLKREDKKENIAITLIKKELDDNKQLKDSFSLTAKDLTKFLNLQVIMLSIVVVMTGGISVGIFWTFREWDELIETLPIFLSFFSFVLAIFLLIYSWVIELHKRKMNKNNHQIEKLIKKSIFSSISEIDMESENWNIAVRSHALKKMVNDPAYKTFLKERLFKKKFSIDKIGYEIEKYCINHIDSIYEYLQGDKEDDISQEKMGE